MKGRIFRIGHLGSLNDLMLCGALCGVEMALGKTGGVDAALEFMAARGGTPRPAAPR
jgi:alanine-glyoxylate transaminase/serine-glyoxylate transaminase/serine-pyruvate transaminase